ncbi:MAG: BA14K family protein [Rhizobiaceae bacterium]
MNRFVKSAVAAIAGLASTIVPMANANAGDWYYDEDGILVERHVVVRHRHNNDDAVAAGIIGLAAGALIVGAISESRRDYRPRRVYRQVPAYDAYPDAPPPPREPYVVQYNEQVEPWSREWYRYCSNRYRSFNPETGTFRGYDGRTRFCVMN